jgi:hypothetical protein
MMEDPIVEEVRRARRKLFAKCGNDLGKLAKYLQEREAHYEDRIVIREKPLRKTAKRRRRITVKS